MTDRTQKGARAECILVVDDEEAIRKRVVSILVAADYECREAHRVSKHCPCWNLATKSISCFTTRGCRCPILAASACWSVPRNGIPIFPW